MICGGLLGVFIPCRAHCRGESRMTPTFGAAIKHTVAGSGIRPRKCSCASFTPRDGNKDAIAVAPRRKRVRPGPTVDRRDHLLLYPARPLVPPI
jgi:hypothetical protein